MNYFGDKIRLRAVERRNLPRYVAWMADPALSENPAGQMPMCLAYEEHRYEENFKQPAEHRALAVDAKLGRGRWEHIGGAGFHVVNTRNRSAECGLFIGPRKYWNKGYGRDILPTLPRYGFDTLNLDRVQPRVMEFNQRAVPLYEKIGFIHKGSMREAHFAKGRYWDMRFHSILRREWEARYGAPKE
jgi:diamine N-acetyltransferase